MREFKVGDKVRIKSNFISVNITGEVIEIVSGGIVESRAKVEWDSNRHSYKYVAVYNTWELEVIQNGVERMIECLE